MTPITPTRAEVFSAKQRVSQLGAARRKLELAGRPQKRIDRLTRLLPGKRDDYYRLKHRREAALAAAAADDDRADPA